MALILTGVFLWTLTHLFRSVTPDLRQTLQQKLGHGAKGLIALVILLSLALMIIGYRGADTVQIWSPPLWMRYVNNLLMFIAVYVYFTTATKPGTAFVLGSLKNPQLVGFKIWAAAHLAVNGDLASILLFGGLLMWAVLQIVVSGRVESLVDRSTAPISSPWIHLALVVFLFIVMVLVHTYLGAYPLAR